jgi:hypothetical protein
MGFGNKWIAWMEMIFGSGTSFVLLKGHLEKSSTVREVSG